MKILLINNNPVVSRLTALSARKEDTEIDEIQEVTELTTGTYDIVFVDADSWTKDVRDVISENIKTKKSVLFYADGDEEEEKSSFDLSILKPFLPSEVSAVIRSIERDKEEPTTAFTEEKYFNILDDTKVNNENELLDLDLLDDIEEKKEDAINLELEDINFDDKLEEAFPLQINTLDEGEKGQENNELFDLDLSDEIPSLEDDLFAENKKEETLDTLDELKLDDMLELTNETKEESSLVSFDDESPIEEVKKETHILDELEIENIKGILTEDTSDDMTLEDLMPAMNVMPSVETIEDEVKVSNTLNHDSSVLTQTLASMPIENLRKLLAGAKVNIKIKFPKSKK